MFVYIFLLILPIIQSLKGKPNKGAIDHPELTQFKRKLLSKIKTPPHVGQLLNFLILRERSFRLICFVPTNKSRNGTYVRLRC